MIKNDSFPKKQHWVPCSYLQFFSINGQRKGRKTKIYFTDGEKSIIASVEDLAFKKYTYSKKNPALDKKFIEMEQDYPLIIDKVLNCSQLKPKEYYGLIMIMSVLNLRNIAFENRTSLERFLVFEGISKSFNSCMFVEARGRGSDMNEMLKHLQKNWRVQLVCAKEDKFISSDNPSIIFTEPKEEKPVLFYLPVNPTKAIIAYDNRKIKMVSKYVTNDALGILNGLQVNLCVKHVFSDHDLMENKDDWFRLKEIIKKEKPERYADEKKWKPGYLSIASPIFNRLTFIEKIK